MVIIEHTENEWRDLCKALIEKVRSISIGLFEWTNKPDEDSGKKIHHIKEYFVEKILFGLEKNSIFSGINFISIKPPYEDIIEKLFNNL